MSAALRHFVGAESLQNATANGDTRTICFHHIHLKEDTTVTFKVNGKYDQDALKKVNHALRDWRTGQPTDMDPHLIDALWEVYRATGAKEPIHVIGGYRSPATNAMLRRRSSGVAKFSQHMLGKAIDFYIPDVELESIRDAGLRVQRGGVGFYPSSGAPFIHMDVGSVRHWPRMPEAQLARIMSKGPLTRVASNNAPAAQKQKSKAAVIAARNVRDEDEDAEVVTRPAQRSRVTASVVPVPLQETAEQVAAAVPMPKVAAAGADRRRPHRQFQPRFRLFAAGARVPRRRSRDSGPGRRFRPRSPRIRAWCLRRDASGAGRQPCRAADDVGERHHQRARLLAGPDRHARAPGPAGGNPCGPHRGRRRSADHRQRRPAPAPWPLPDRAGRAAMAYAPANTVVETRPGQAAKARVVAKLPAAQQHDAGTHGTTKQATRSAPPGVQGRRALQQSVDARDDRVAERARFHEHLALRRPRHRLAAAAPGEARRHRDDDVLRRSVSRHVVRAVPRQCGGVRGDRDVPAAHRGAALIPATISLPLVPAKAGTQFFLSKDLDSRLRGNERRREPIRSGLS